MIHEFIFVNIISTTSRLEKNWGPPLAIYHSPETKIHRRESDMIRRQLPNVVTICLWVLFLAGLAMFVNTAINGLFIFELSTFNIVGLDFSLQLRFDPLTSPIFSMVGLLGVAISHYGIRYLDGEPQQNRFYLLKLFLILSVSLLVLSNNLIMFFFMWITTSYILHKLLILYPDRPSASQAARKKQIISRLGDFAILSAIFLSLWVFGTTDFSELFQLAKNQMIMQANRGFLEVIGSLFAVGAATKSAQVPFHFWLSETMETPSPVSALMHAGVINAGGFLMIRMSPLLQSASVAHAFLIAIGAFTASYAGLMMVTQNNIKKKLAFSTMSQMGMMMFACGLGAYAVALFHIVAHSFYKAHAFLSTGYLIEETKQKSLKLRTLSPSLSIAAIVVAFSTVVIGQFFEKGIYISYFAYAAVLILGLIQTAFHVRYVEVKKSLLFSSIFLFMTAGLIVYMQVEFLVGHFIRDVIPPPSITSQLNSVQLPVIYLAIALFSACFILSGLLMNPKTTLLKKTYIHLWNGGYANHYFNRWLSKFLY